MNRTVQILVFISILAGLTCCSRDMIDDPDSFVPEGYVRATLDLQVEKPDSIVTRATSAEEDAYDESNVWALLFNATSDSDKTPTTLVQAPVKAIKSGNTLHVLLRATTQPVTLYLVAGLSPALNTYMATATNFGEGITDFATVNSQLQTADITTTGVPIGSGAYFHMSSELISYPAGTIPITSITESLTRNVAKINIDASAVTSDFVLEGVTLANGAKIGFVLRQPDIPTNNGGTLQYEEKTFVTGNKLTSEIYLYENAGFFTNGTTPNPTKLIVRGKYKGGESSYYRMDILKNDGGTYIPYDIKRNFCYTLKIEKIENGGYRTFNEALAGEPSNTWYNVVVNDPDSYDIVSNGHYYLGVSNSEFIVYGDPGQIDNLHITTVTTDAPTGTKTSISASSDLTLITTSLTTPNGAATTTKIYATLNSIGTSHIDLRVGNLTKRIIVRRGQSVVYENSEKADFIAPEYTTGEVVSGMEWVRLAAASNANFNVSPPSLVNPNGGIYVRYNSTGTMNNSRSAELYVSKTNDQGRAKMVLFATAVKYISSTLPNNIDKNGMDINSASTFTATFSNPGNYPFTAGITPASSSTILMETTSDVNAVKSINLEGVKAGGLENLPRGLTLKYKVNDVWFETGRNFQQRTFLNVRILSVGGSAININNGSTVDYGTKLGTVVAENHYTNGIGRMLYLHTGSGKPIENKFELFNLSHGPTSLNNGPVAYTNIGNTLRANNIDILYCSINQGNHGGAVGPDASQTQEILEWLDENPYRGLIFITDYDDNANITKALFGVAQNSSSGTAPYSKLLSNDPYYNNPVYKAIMCGSYSTTYSATGNPIDLRTTEFKNIPSGNAYGGVPLTKTNAAGFIPIFYVTINSVEYVLFAVHPSKNIVMMGDINWFDSRQGFVNATGSLNATTYGNYPKMIMNMWEWYINSVALGRGY